MVLNTYMKLQLLSCSDSVVLLLYKLPCQSSLSTMLVPFSLTRVFVALARCTAAVKVSATQLTMQLVLDCCTLGIFALGCSCRPWVCRRAVSAGAQAGQRAHRSAQQSVRSASLLRTVRAAMCRSLHQQPRQITVLPGCLAPAACRSSCHYAQSASK